MALYYVPPQETARLFCPCSHAVPLLCLVLLTQRTEQTCDGTPRGFINWNVPRKVFFPRSVEPTLCFLVAVEQADFKRGRLMPAIEKESPSDNDVRE